MPDLPIRNRDHSGSLTPPQARPPPGTPQAEARTPVWTGHDTTMADVDDLDPAVTPITTRPAHSAGDTELRPPLGEIDPVYPVPAYVVRDLVHDEPRPRTRAQIMALNRAPHHDNNSSSINTTAHADQTNTLQEMVDDPTLEDTDPEDPLIFDTTNDPHLRTLREISSLASWTVSTHKPACGSAALLNPSPHTFWQSDGPQPHKLTIHFFKLVTVVKLRVYLDFLLDESYTPTRMEFWGGMTGEYGLVEFATWRGEEPRGWQEIDLEGVGVGGRAELRCFVLQIRVTENHQNGKDTHVRGVQVFAKDERVKQSASGEEGEGEASGARGGLGMGGREFVGEEPDWMAEPEIR